MQQLTDAFFNSIVIFKSACFDELTCNKKKNVLESFTRQIKSLKFKTKVVKNVFLNFITIKV